MEDSYCTTYDFAYPILKQKTAGLFNRFPSFRCYAVYGSSEERTTDHTLLDPVLDLAVKLQNKTAQIASY